MARPLGPAESSMEPVWSKISKLRLDHTDLSRLSRETAAAATLITELHTHSFSGLLLSHTHWQRMARHSNPREPNRHWWVLSLKRMWFSCSGCWEPAEYWERSTIKHTHVWLVSAKDFIKLHHTFNNTHTHRHTGEN